MNAFILTIVLLLPDGTWSQVTDTYKTKSACVTERNSTIASMRNNPNGYKLVRVDCAKGVK